MCSQCDVTEGVNLFVRKYQSRHAGNAAPQASRAALRPSVGFGGSLGLPRWQQPGRGKLWTIRGADQITSACQPCDFGSSWSAKKARLPWTPDPPVIGPKIGARHSGGGYGRLGLRGDGKSSEADVHSIKCRALPQRSFNSRLVLTQPGTLPGSTDYPTRNPGPGAVVATGPFGLPMIQIRVSCVHSGSPFLLATG